MALTCAVQNCSSGGYWLKKWRKQLCSVHGCLHEEKFCNCSEPFRLFTFPTKKRRPAAREKWKQLVGRSSGTKLWLPPKDSRVCSRHFVDGEPTVQNPLPTLDMGYDGADMRVKRMVDFDATLPAVQKRRRVSSTSTTKRIDELLVATPLFEDPAEEVLPKCNSDLPRFMFLLVLIVGIMKELCDQKKKADKLAEEAKKLKETVLKLKQTVYSDRILRTDKFVNFHTGLANRNIFNKLHDKIAPYVVRGWTGAVAALKRVRTIGKTSKVGPQRKMTSKSEFLLMLMKIRLGLLNKHLSKRFDISETLVSRIFFSWLRASFAILKSLVYMPGPEELTASKPERFRKFSDLHSIIDCTELFVETPKDLYLQSASWSDYKHHNTLKLLIACAPNSLIVYVSPVYLGRTSDKALTLDCGYLDLVHIMADKGFNIMNDCAERNISLYVPPGKRGQSQMSSACVEKTKKIANHRILIEQVIRRLKTFRFCLTNCQYHLQVTQMKLLVCVQVCAILRNQFTKFNCIFK